MMSSKGARTPLLFVLCMMMMSLLKLAVVVADPFACSTPHAISTQPAASSLCQCADGWFGPTCQICTEDQACSVLLKSPDGVCRNTTFTAIKELNGWCEIAGQDIGNLIHGTGYVQLYYNSNATFFFDFVKRRPEGNFLSLFRCSSKKTTVTVDPVRHEVRYASPDLVCKMTCTIGSERTCTQGLDGIVKQVSRSDKGGGPGKRAHFPPLYIISLLAS